MSEVVPHPDPPATYAMKREHSMPIVVVRDVPYQLSDRIISRYPFCYSMIAILRDIDIRLTVDEHRITAGDSIQARPKTATIDNNVPQLISDLPSQNSIIRRVQDVHRISLVDIDCRWIVQLSQCTASSASDTCYCISYVGS